MASVLTSPVAPALTPEGLTLPIPEIAEAPVSAAPAHAVPARLEVKMGRAASVGAGVNWLTLGVIIAFHIGALAALFFFSWQRLVAMLVLHVIAINVGIGMTYHRLLTHRGYQVPKWLEYVMATCARKATRTPRAKAAGGRTPAGSFGEAPCTCRPKFWAATPLISPKTATWSG
jgi:hypothetical protein